MTVKEYCVKKMLNRWEERDNRILARQSLPADIRQEVDIPYIDDGNRGHLLDVERLQGIFHLEAIDADIKALALICGMMGFDEPTVGYWGMRSMCFERGYKKPEYYQNMIFEHLPELAALPPTFLSTSDEDELRHMTLNFEETLKKYGVDCQLKYYQKVPDKRLGHMFSVLHPEFEQSGELMDEMTNFFRKAAQSLDCAATDTAQ